MSGWDKEYTDDMRLDEMNTADDYNRFEEEQLARDRDAGEFDDYDNPDEEPDLKLAFSGWGAEPYRLRYIDLEDAIRAEARKLADDAGSDLIDEPTVAARDALEREVIADATAALRAAGDRYHAPDDSVWRLEEDDDV